MIQKSHFTMIPNCMLDNLSMQEIAIYCIIKQHAGEQGESFVSNKSLSEKFKISRNTVTKIYKSLEKKKLIKFKRFQKSLKGKPVSVYSVVNYWEYNNIYHNAPNKTLSSS